MKGLNVKVYTNVDKTNWPEGPWNDEPDKIQWIDEDTDLDCLIVRGPLGALCGYVGVPSEHPAFGESYQSLPNLEVHGGLTFADLCMEDMPEGKGVCHVPFDSRPDLIWWLGFDCGHYMDVIPGMGDLGRHKAGLGRTELEGTYRTVEYVKEEVTRLAKQVADYKNQALQGGQNV